MSTIPDPGFSGDDGAAEADLAAALAAYATAPEASHAPTLAQLQHARLLVPVVAVLDEAEHDERGLKHEKSSEMAAVLMRGRDGRLALLAFTSTQSMRSWNPEARPVPVTAATAAVAAVHEGAEALVVDVAGPVRFVVEEHDLRALADGYTLIRLQGRHRWAKAQ